MPTFNQLVRKGREKSTYKSNSPAMQKGLNTLKNCETDLSSPQSLIWSQKSKKIPIVCLSADGIFKGTYWRKIWRLRSNWKYLRVRWICFYI